MSTKNNEMSVSRPVDPVRGEFGDVDFLPGWRGKSPVQDLAEIFKVRVALENDGDAAALAEVHASGQLAHNLNIQIAQALRFQRRNRAQRLQNFDRAHIYIQAHTFAQFQQPALRPLPYRKRIPLRSANRA